MKKPALFLAAATVAIAVGCGGSTKDSNPNEGSGASGGTAGRGGSAGSGAGAGSGGGGASGSSGSAGSTGDAGVSGTGTGGSDDGGVVPTDCNAPPESYGCEGGDNSFYFDSAAGVCKPYGAYRCSYNKANRFSSLAKCVATCPGARPDVNACDHAAECFMVDNGCCAACEPVRIDSLTVVNYTRMNDFRPPCPPIACGACPPADELATTRQYFVATCHSGTCGMFDIRNTGYTECSADADCVLRDGAQCCNGCDDMGLVSLNKQPPSPLCDSPMSCPACEPGFPGYAPKCVTGYCRVTRTGN